VTYHRPEERARPFNPILASPAQRRWARPLSTRILNVGESNCSSQTTHRGLLDCVIRDFWMSRLRLGRRLGAIKLLKWHGYR